MGNRFIYFILLIILISSCKRANPEPLMKLTESCKCKVTSHLKYSIGIKSDNSLKEFDFKDSPIFENGVPKHSFALSSAILIQDTYNFNLDYKIKINLIESNSNKKTKTAYYIFDTNELNKFSSNYFHVSNLINQFIVGIREENYNVCVNMILSEISVQELSNILKSVNGKLNYEYLDIKIVGYTFTKSEYIIQGGIYDHDKTLNLFNINLIKVKDDFKISSFEF